MKSLLYFLMCLLLYLMCFLEKMLEGQSINYQQTEGIKQV